MTTRDELVEHFKECGKIARVTIVSDKFTGHPKGFAYVEFEDCESVETAKILNDSLLRGRQIKVLPKRTN
jgi:polyadenylate-binding protein 2